MTSTATATAAVGPPGRPLHARLVRRRDDRLLGGVAAGLAEHLAVQVLMVRLVFVVLALLGGSGILAYAIFWGMLPQAAQPHGRARAGRRGQVVVLVAVAAIGFAGLNVLGLGSPTVLPLLAATAGIGLFWRQADDTQRAHWRLSAGLTGWLPLLRALAGLVLLGLGVAGFLASRGDLAKAREGLLSTFVVVGGLALVALPWWLRAARELRREARERIRAQERAELSAQVHDSVLQTLALIQKVSDDPREVVRLARVQERELRGWLYRPAAAASTFAGALEQAAAEVEEARGVPVEVVVVGDAPCTDGLRALVAAARESVVNAAKHSGAPQVQVYAEVETGQVTVFVRDRGTGFDPAAVPADRYGLAESVTGRIARVGGQARVRSEPGEGTEVRLQVPR